MSGKRKAPLFVKNAFGEVIPACPYCASPYDDGAIFDVKNYPDDGAAAMFLMCESCRREAEIVFEWKKLSSRPTVDISNSTIPSWEDEHRYGYIIPQPKR